jgi:hypothetical protein
LAYIRKIRHAGCVYAYKRKIRLSIRHAAKIYVRIRVGFVYKENEFMRHAAVCVCKEYEKQLGQGKASAMMECDNLQCRHVDSSCKLRPHCS